MQLGVQIEPQFGFRFTEIRDIARDAERAGFATLWLSDHLFLNADSARTDCLEAWTTLAALAQATERIRLGPMVTAQSYRNPALLAKIAAGVDQLSGGRIEFGLGAGWKELEYRAYGYAFPDAKTRVDQLVETLEICTRLWREEKATYRGAHYRIQDAQCSPKPAQSPFPIWIGGSKPRIMRIAARYAAWFNMTTLPVPMEDRLRIMEDGLLAACRAVGRDPATLRRSLFLPVTVAETVGDLTALVAEQAANAGLSPEAWRAARPHAVIGTVEEVATRLRGIAPRVDHANVIFAYGHERAGISALAETARALARLT